MFLLKLQYDTSFKRLYGVLFIRGNCTLVGLSCTAKVIIMLNSSDKENKISTSNRWKLWNYFNRRTTEFRFSQMIIERFGEEIKCLSNNLQRTWFMKSERNLTTKLQLLVIKSTLEYVKWSWRSKFNRRSTLNNIFSTCSAHIELYTRKWVHTSVRT